MGKSRLHWFIFVALLGLILTVALSFTLYRLYAGEKKPLPATSVRCNNPLAPVHIPPNPS